MAHERMSSFHSASDQHPSFVCCRFSQACLVDSDAGILIDFLHLS